jgi:signal transduction histidine kinase
VNRYEEIVRTQSQLKELSARLVAAQEEERRAISRELHDEVGQSLSALLMEAGTAASLTPPDLDDLKLRLETIKGLAEGSVNLIRNMALLLRPSMLDDLGLVPALRWQAREVSKRTGLKVRMTAEGVPDDLPDEHKTCIFRVVQEALNNCARHAQAHTVRVQVQSKDETIFVSIQDDGIGFDAKLLRGLGQVGMEERVAHVGGRFQIDSAPGRGTLLTAELPLLVNHL